MLVLIGKFHGTIEGGAGLGGLLGFQVLVAAPAAHGGDDQDCQGNNVDGVLVPQLLELIATYFLIYFIK